MPWSREKADGGGRRQVRSCSVYEIDGRLIVRTLDRSDGLGIERDEHVQIDGFPDVAAAALGTAVAEALDRAREIARPTSWRSLSEYAQPLLAASPGRYRSYRSWQR
ncbi:MAG: hypothetical protein QOG98_1417, partial [Pseudonocardiales bacterium]|nr:hypothetical protein [Pseudonocardiales bacterium]